MAGVPLIAAAFAVGIYLAARMQIPIVYLLALILAAFAATCVLTILKKPAVAALLFLFCLMGMFTYGLAEERLHTPLYSFIGQERVYSGYISEVLPTTDESIRFIFHIEEVQTTAGEQTAVGAAVRIHLYNQLDLFIPEYGRRLQLIGIIQLPSGQRNPGGFNYAEYLGTKGIGATMSVKNGSLEVLSGQSGNFILAYFERKRQQAKAVFTHYLPEAAAGLASGMILGQRTEVADKTVEAYQQLGLAHLLAVSGLHVGFVAAFALFICTRIFGRRYIFLQYILIMLLILSYTLLTGGMPPVWRAAVTLLLAFGARQAGRENDGLQALAVSALLMLFFRPLWLFSISFQFSFVATAGILLITPRLKPILQRLPRAVAGPLAVTLGAQLAVLPLQVTHFGILSLLSLPLNLLCVPLVGIVMTLGLAALLLGFVWLPLAGILCWSSLPLFVFLERVPRMLAVIPWSSMSLPTLPPLWWGVYVYLLILFIAGNKLKPLDGKKVLTILLVINLLLFSSISVSQRGRLRITFLDVGQGLAVHIQTPVGHHLLVDAGGQINAAGENIVLPYLHVHRVNKLDLLILTHPHEDHYGGLTAVAAKMPAAAFISNGQEEATAAYADLLKLIDDKGIPRHIVSAGYQIKLDQVIIDVLSPPSDYLKNTGDDVNNNSLVLLITYRDFSCLLTGDAETEAFARLLIEESGQIKANVIQVPHHGSRGALSAAFLAEVGAQAAVISVGRNRFGHPHTETLALLDKQQLQVFRTDEHGAVTISSNGTEWESHSFVAPMASRIE